MILAQGDLLGLASDTTLDAEILGAVDVSVAFGIDLNPDLSTEQAFFVRGTEIDLSVAMNTTDTAIELTVGFLDAAAIAGIHLDAEAHITLNDVVPDDLQNVTLSELNGYDAEDIAAISVTSGALDASFDVSATLGTWTASGSPGISVSGTAVGQIDPDVTVNADFAELQNFNHLNANSLLNGLELFGTVVAGFSDSSVLRTAIPFTQGATLGNQFMGAAEYFNQVAAWRGDDGQPSFQTAQQFANLAGIDVDYDPSSDRLVFPMDMNFAPQRTSVPLEFTENTSPLSHVATNSLAQLTSSAAIEFEFEVDLTQPGQQPENQFSADHVTLRGRTDQNARNLVGSARYGIVGVDFSGGSYSGTSDFRADLGHPRTASTEATLGELLDGLATPKSLLHLPLSPSGSTELVLNNVAVQDALFDVPLAAGASITATVADLDQPEQIDLSLLNTGVLGNFANLTIDTLANSFAAGIADAVNWYDAPVDALGVIGTTLNDLVEEQVIEAVADVVMAGFEAYESVTGTAVRLQDVSRVVANEIQALIDSTLHLASDVIVETAAATIDIGLTLTGDVVQNVLDFGLSISELASATGDAALEGIGEFAGTGDALKARVSTELQLDYEFDLTVPDAPEAYLATTSFLNTNVYVNAPSGGSTLTANGSLGVLDLALDKGSLVVAADVTNPLPSQPAIIAIGLEDSAIGGRYLVHELDQAALEVSASGQLEFDYQIAEPGIVVGSDHLHFQINDLNQPSSTTVLISPPDFNTLVASVDLESDLAALPDALDDLFAALESGLQSQVFGLDFPLIGNAIGDAANFIRGLRRDINVKLGSLTDFSIAKVTAAIESVIEARLGGLVTVDLSNLDDIRFTLDLSDVPIDKTGDNAIQTNTNLGLPALGVSFDASLDVQGSYDFRVIIGISKTDGVYLDTKSDLIGVNLDVDVAASLAGRLGFIEVTAEADTSHSTCTTSTGQPTAFHAGFHVDLTGINDNRLTLDELPAGNFIDMSTTGLDGCADIDLVVGAGANIDGEPLTWMPSIETTLSIDWDFDGSDLTGNIPEVTYDGLGINLGEFLSKTIGPVLVGIDNLFDGIRPVLEVIAAPFPVIGDYIPDPDSLIEIASTAFPFLKPLEIFAEAALRISDLTDAIEITSDDPKKTVIEFGTLRFGADLDCGGSQNDGCDARRSDLSFNLDEQVTLLTGNSALDDLLAKAPAFDLSLSRATTSGFEVEFPLLERPLGLFEFVLGLGEAEIFTVTLPSLDLAVPIEMTVPVYPPFLDAGIYGSIESFFKLSFGYDTAGLREFFETGDPLDLLLGFYASDTAAPDGSGADIDQLSFSGKALAGVGTGVDGLLEANVGGGLEASLAADLLDHDGDGKVRGDEFVSEEGCLKLTGELTGTLEANLNTPLKDFNFPFTQKSLGSFNEIFRCTLPGGPPGPPTGTLATLTDEGQLVLSVGSQAFNRSIQQDEIDEIFSVTRTGTPDGADDMLVVSAFGIIEEFPTADVKSILADAGSGDDWITIDFAIMQPAELQGGSGNDVLIGGSGKDTIDGGIGNDTIDGQNGIDTLTGGEGNDTIYGGNEIGLGDTIDAGEGDDEVHGGEGDDQIVTGDGLNIVFGDAGKDTITGGADRDVIYGGDNDDEIRGEDGDDVILGEGGFDRLFGGDGDDLIDGGTGGDTIFGNRGADTIYGGDEDDVITGQGGADYIEGGLGNDTIDGGTEADTIYGGEDDDTIRGNGGNDWLFGDAGIDEIHGNQGADNIEGGSEADDLSGDEGNDVIHGNDGPDTISGGLGDDLLYGDDEKDTIHGNAGPNGSPIAAGQTDRDTIYGGNHGDTLSGDDDDDLIFGEEGNDVIHGNDGNDTLEGGDQGDQIFGDDGEDEIRGDDGNDTLDGGNHNDLIRGGEGDDNIFGRSGTDSLFGDAGDDYLEGGTQDDLIDSGTGNDHALGQDGDDQIFGDDGNDVLEGNNGHDRLRGNRGSDVMYGDNGVDDLAGGPDNDTMRGGEGDDVMRGGDGDDLMLGHTGVDLIFGDLGNDVLYGYLGDDLLDGGVGNDRLMGEQDNDTLVGGLGDDILEGGPGDDTLDGDAGRDQLHGDAGVDTLSGGPDDDFLWAGEGIGNRLQGDEGNDHIIGSDAGRNDPNLKDGILFGDHIEGGPGDDVIESLGGADIIIAGLGNDTIFGGEHGDYIIGGPGAASGRDDDDTIYGQAGDDLLEGGDGDDVIDGGDGADSIDGGAGVNTIDQTPAPEPAFSLSQGPDLTGDWVELSGSATGGGLTQVGGFEESTFATEFGVYVTWVDWRNGNSEVYLAYHANAGGDWTAFNGSATGGGVSHDAQQSRRPTVVEIKNFNTITQKLETELLVAWTKIDASGASSIEVARLDHVQGWTRVNNPNLQTGTADHPQFVPFADESALLGWLDTSTGMSHVNVIQYIFEPTCFVNFRDASDLTASVNPTADVSAYDLATARFRLAVATSFGSQGDHAVDVAVTVGHGILDENTLCPAAPNANVAVLTLGIPIWVAGTFTDGDAVEPAVGMRLLAERQQGDYEQTLEAQLQIQADVYVAWHRITDREDQVESRVIRQDFTGMALPGEDWEEMVPQYFADRLPRTNASGVSDTIGYAGRPVLATSDGYTFLTWMDDGVHDGGDGRSAVYVMSAEGAERVLHEVLADDASGSGISPTGGALQSLSITVAATGEHNDAPYVAWTDAQPGMPQVYLRHNPERSFVRLPGDFNGDGRVTVADVNAMRTGVRTASGPYDLDGDGKVELADLEYLVERIMGSSIGDANLDGIFNSSDFVTIFQAGQYEDNIEGNSTWSEGDWNGDGEFSSSDLVYAFQKGRYEVAVIAALAEIVLPPRSRRLPPI